MGRRTMRYFGLTKTLKADDEWREPDLYINDETSRFADKITALADGGAWHGLWTSSTH